MTRSQWGFVAFFVSLPFILLLILTLIFPGYMVNFYDRSYWTHAPTNVVQLSIVKLAFLNIAFRFNNRRKAKLQKPRKWDLRDTMISISSVFLFTLPALFLVVIYPRFVIAFRLGV